MTRNMFFAVSVVSLLLLAGCGGGVRDLQVIPPQTIDSLPAVPHATLAAGPDGAILLATPEKIFRVHPPKSSIETIFEGNTQNSLSAMTVADDGLLYVADRNQLKLFAGGRLHNLLETHSDRGSGKWLLSAYGETTLYLANGVTERTTLFSYDTHTKEVFGVAEFDQPIHAVAAVRGGCLVATTNTIYKVFDRSDDVAADVLCLMVCSIASKGRQIRALAVDENRRAVYFTTEDGTWAYVDGQIVPLLPVGGVLAFAGDTLSVWDIANRQLLQIGHPAKRARSALKVMFD